MWEKTPLKSLDELLLSVLRSAVAKITGPKLAQTTVTVGFILVW